MKLVIGLGNPGKEYEKTRHNCGFRVIEKLEEVLHVRCNQVKFQGLYVKCRYHQEDLILFKPTTYMNLSGQAVAEIMRFYKLKPEDIIVIYDDLDTAVGKIRLRETGNAGGHNGMKNIIAHLGTNQFKRIRVGIGRDMNVLIIDYVLKKIPKADQPAMEEAFEKAKDAVLLSLDRGFNQAMNQYN